MKITIGGEFYNRYINNSRPPTCIGLLEDKEEPRRVALITLNVAASECPSWNMLESGKRNSHLANIEKSIYNETIDVAAKKNILPQWGNIHFKVLYSQMVFEKNINPHSWVDAFIDGKITNVGQLSWDDLNPPPTQLKRRIEDKQNVSAITRKTTSLYKCGNCGARRSIFRQKQNRGLDEGQSTLLTCVECKHEWTDEG